MIFLHRCSLIKTWNMWKRLDRWRVFLFFWQWDQKNRFSLRKGTSRRSSFWSATKSFLHLLCKLYFDFQVSSIVVLAHVISFDFTGLWVPINSDILPRKCFLTSHRNFHMYSTGLPGNALECSCELPLLRSFPAIKKENKTDTSFPPCECKSISNSLPFSNKKY